MVGMERGILPIVAQREFALEARAAVLLFIVVFGLTKAFTNYFAGRLSDKFSRKNVFVAGWLVATPVPFLLMFHLIFATGFSVSTGNPAAFHSGNPSSRRRARRPWARRNSTARSA